MLIEKLLGDPTPFLKKIFTALDKDRMDVSKYELDHICYRIETSQKYGDLKQKLHECGSFLNEMQISGRAISTFKLNKPIIFKNRRIWLLELPAPKPGRFYAEGFEHVEFVIDVNFDEFTKLYSHITFDTKAIFRKTNPEIKIKYDGFSVKFHRHNLEYVIKYLQ